MENKWIYFLMSLGSIFVILYPTDSGSVQHLILGLGLMVVSFALLFAKKSKK